MITYGHTIFYHLLLALYNESLEIEHLKLSNTLDAWNNTQHKDKIT